MEVVSLHAFFIRINSIRIVRINKNIDAQHSDDILRIMSVRIFRLVSKICAKNI